MPIQDSDIHPIDTVVRWKRTGEFGMIKSYTFQKDNHGFMRCLVMVEGKQGLYCWFHQDVDLECLPCNSKGTDI